MSKPPGTPDGVGLVHMPLLRPAYPVTYLQVGGFGPVSRPEAFAAIKQAGNIGRVRPDTVWIQKGTGAMDDNLTHAFERARAEFRIMAELIKDGPKANEGWGLYYQYGRYVIVEHTSDPNSMVEVKAGNSTQTRQLPHFHVEEAAVGSVAATRSGQSLTVQRVERIGAPSPFTEHGAKLNHHVYYVPGT
jgi:hypothetical protein